jgi:hypothetical protein
MRGASRRFDGVGLDGLVDGRDLGLEGYEDDKKMTRDIGQYMDEK